jgi:hypothetical protein
MVLVCFIWGQNEIIGSGYAAYSNNKVFGICIFIPSFAAYFFGIGIIGIGVKKWA